MHGDRHKQLWGEAMQCASLSALMRTSRPGLSAQHLHPARTLFASLASSSAGALHAASKSRFSLCLHAAQLRLLARCPSTCLLREFGRPALQAWHCGQRRSNFGLPEAGAEDQQLCAPFRFIQELEAVAQRGQQQ